MQYKFIVDGQWRHDPNLPSMYDDMGNINNVMEVQVRCVPTVFSARLCCPVKCQLCSVLQSCPALLQCNFLCPPSYLLAVLYAPR